MAQEFITKTYEKKKDGVKTEVKTTYRIDKDFVPTKNSEICYEFIANFCEAKGNEAIEWLIAIQEKMVERKDKDGNVKMKNEKPVKQRLTDKEIIKEFIDKYFPELKAKAKEEPKYKSRIEALKKALNK